MSPTELIDLRSDTLTLPTAAMRECAHTAQVGDDGRVNAEGRGEDPSINLLEDTGAAVLGKEAALFFCSGTLANFTSLLTHCVRGDVVACDPDLHVVRTEKAAFMDRFGGLIQSPYTRDAAQMPDVASFRAACSVPKTRLACLENTHNYAGGTCTDLPRMRELAAVAKEQGLPVHLDGARLFNAALALGIHVADLAACADTVQFCLSKGLGAPVGSLLCGSKAFIAEARETRKLLGGVMRQAGLVAAAGLEALRTGVTRLEEDHENAKMLGKSLADFPGLRLVPVQTNIVMLNVTASGQKAGWFEKELKSYGVLGKAMGDEHLRFTTYRGITRHSVTCAAAAFHTFMRDHSTLLTPKAQ